MAHLTLTGTRFISYMEENKLFLFIFVVSLCINISIYFSVSFRRNEIEGGHHRSKFTTTTGKSVELRKPEVRKIGGLPSKG